MKISPSIIVLLIGLTPLPLLWFGIWLNGGDWRALRDELRSIRERLGEVETKITRPAPA
jgi:hypothetical protein